MSYYIFQSLYSYVGKPSITVFNDIVLDKPVLTAPDDGVTICKYTTLSETISLTWNTVSSANVYIVQICGNSQFAGPTLTTKKISAPTTNLNLIVGTDINYGITYYWRIFAYNTTGGASPKSETRSFIIQCENQNDSSDSSCDSASLDIKLLGVTKANCNDKLTISATYKISGGYTLNSVVWNITGDFTVLSSTNNRITLQGNGSTNKKLKIELCLKVQKGGNSEIQCCKNKDIAIDCISNNTKFVGYVLDGISGFYVQDKALYLLFNRKPLYYAYNSDYVLSYIYFGDNYPLYYSISGQSC